MKRSVSSVLQDYLLILEMILINLRRLEVESSRPCDEFIEIDELDEQYEIVSI